MGRDAEFLRFPTRPAVKRWLKRHPRFHLHFTPLSTATEIFSKVARAKQVL
jgi:hypothetical protein